ncbi:MAG: hypothetical protein ACI4PF_06940, partial [Christensenellales bacterium]
NKTIRAGGVAGVNTGIICKSIDQMTLEGNNSFVVSSGLSGFDVAVIINPGKKLDNVNRHSTFGGVVGINASEKGVDDEYSGVVDGLSVRCFVYGINSVGGIVGTNYARVSNNIVIPNLIGIINVGGLIGSSMDGLSSLTSEFGNVANHYISANKVQFLDFKDNYSYFNTAIFGFTYVGGLIGYYSTNVNLLKNAYNEITDLTFDSVISYNSVMSYYNREVSTAYNRNNMNNLYYGDICLGLISNGQQYVSNFIGYANNGLISSAYANAIVVAPSKEDVITNSDGKKETYRTYFGGIIGRADGLTVIFNTTALGTVYDANSTNNVYINNGGFIGYANELNTYKVDNTTKYLLHISATTTNASGEYIYQPASAENLYEISPSLTDLNNLNFSKYYNINVKDVKNNLLFKFGNIVSSVSSIDYVKNTRSAITNKVASGESREIYSENNFRTGDIDVPGAMIVMYNGQRYVIPSNSSIKVTNVISYNSLVAGSDITMYLSIKLDDGNNTYYTEVPVNNKGTINLATINEIYEQEVDVNGINEPSNYKYKFYLSAYSVPYTYSEKFDGKEYKITTKTFFFDNVEYSFSGKTSANSDSVFVRGAISCYDNGRIVLGTGEVSKTVNDSPIYMKPVYISNNVDNSGFNLDASNSIIYPNGQYLKYFNEQVYSYPISFGRNDTFIEDNSTYVNMIINLAPTVIQIGQTNAINNRIDYENVWLSTIITSSSGKNTINANNTTIFFYELDYSKITYVDQTINGETVRVIDLNMDGRYSLIDVEYSRYIANLINDYNTYKLSKVMGITIWPPFLQNGMVIIESNNPNIAEVVIIDGEVYIQVKGIGSVEFEVYSAYNPNEEDRKSFSLNIINAINTFGLYDNLSYNNEISEITIVKNEEITTNLFAKFNGSLVINNSYLNSYMKDNKLLKLKTNNTYGIRYFYVENDGSNDTIFFTGDREVDKVLVNGNSFERLHFSNLFGKDDKYALYADGEDQLKLTGIDEGYVKLLAVPYIVNNGQITYLYDFTQDYVTLNSEKTGYVSGGIAKLLEIKIIKGTYGVKTTSSQEISPLNTANIKVTVDTDDEESSLYFYINKDNKKVSIYNDENKFNLTAYDSDMSGYIKVEEGAVYFFDKVQLKVISRDEIYVDEELVSIEYNFRLSIVEKYLFDDDLPNIYELNFAVVDYNNENQTASTNVKINRQEINDSMAIHFSSVDQYVTNQEIYEINDYYASNTLVSGYAGLIQLDLFPNYSNVDYIEIVSNEVSGYYISLEQLVAVYDSTNTYFDGYYTTHTKNREIIENGRGIKIRKFSNMYTQESTNYYTYDGKFYIRTIVPTIAFGSTDFTITYRSYYQGIIQENGCGTLNITVTRAPGVELTINGEDSGVIAFGKTIYIDVDADAEVLWSVEEGSLNLEDVATSTEPVWLSSNRASIDIKKISDLGSYSKYIGKDIILKGTVSLDVNGRIYTSSDTIKIRLALFTIDSIEVKYVNKETNKFEGVYNQPYDLMILLNASYDEEYDALNGGIISSRISYYANELSKAQSKSFYVLNGNIENQIEVGRYADFEITQSGEYFLIKNNTKNPTSSLKAIATFEYTSANSDGIVVNPRVTGTEFVYEKSTTFGLQFSRLSNEEYPEPIYTAEELMNMEEGGYYILLADITLEDWTPLNVAIASLDGNGYVLTIKSFYDTKLEISNDEENNNSNSLVLGIFSEISSTTTIKNLIIEVKNDTSLTSDIANNSSTSQVGDLTINVANYNQVHFGLLAGENKGIITNVRITNNANSYRNERNELLLSRGLITEYEVGSELNYSIIAKDNSKVLRRLSIVSLDYGNITSSATENRIGGLVGINSGYISNSNINNISIRGLDCVAGFVAENEGVISSSYFAGANVSAQVSAESVDTLGASAFVFTNSGRIAYSYAIGGNYSENLIGQDIGNFTGFNYTNSNTRLRSTGVISLNGNSSGFVYNNSGSIDDSYSNILVYGAKATGFVYTNSGTINNVYTLSSVRKSDSNNYPFISMLNENRVTNNSGTIDNAYYLKVVSSDFKNSSGVEDSYNVEDSLQIALPISLEKLSNYNTFESFAFSPSYDNVVTEDAIDKLIGGVWFYPNSLSINCNYFEKNNYISGAPQLVSANLKTYSLKYYVSDNSSRIIETIYSNMLAEYAESMSGFRRDNIVTTIIETTSTTLLTKISEHLTAEQVVNKINSYNTLSNAYSDISVSDFPNLLYQYISIEMYFDEDAYEKLSDNTNETNIKNMIIKSVLDNKLFTNHCYFDINFIKIDEENQIPETINNYEYYSILENKNGLSIEYGESILNPYLIKTASDYNTFVNQTDEDGTNYTELNYKSDKYLRLITDITFDNNELNVETFNVIFSGLLDGNGMQISDLRINANTSISNDAINKQQEKDSKYEETEVYLSSTDADNKKVTSVGMFAKLTDGAVVKNLTLNVAEVFGTGVNYVGVVAGQVIDSMIYNVTVNGENTEISGLNAVGGIAGRVTGDSTLVNLTSNISVTANYYTSYNTFNYKNNLNINSGYNVYISTKDEEPNDDNGTIISTVNTVSYAGGLVGIIDLDKSNITGVISSNEVNPIRNLTLNGSTTIIIGEIVGGVVGYIGKDTNISSAQTYVGINTVLQGSRIAGGLVGHNQGIISRSFVSNDKQVQESIDEALASMTNVSSQIYRADSFDNENTEYSTVGSTKFFGSNPHYIGGIVGLNKEGSVVDSYNKVNVNNINSLYAGGVIGVNIGGQINAVYTTADVYAFKGIGGIVGLNTGYNASKEDALNKKYDTTGLDSDEDKLGLFINNYTSFKVASSENPTLNMEGIVGINIWNYSSLNTRRAYLNNDAKEANVGSLIGYQSDKASDIGINAVSERMWTETIYTISTYTYNSIYSYNNSSSKDSYYSFELINEIGNIDSSLTLSDGGVYNEETHIFQKVHKFGDLDMYCGTVVKVSESKDTIEDSSHFSRLRQYSSVRTLPEILNRVYNQDLAINNLTRISASGKNSNSPVSASEISEQENIIFNISDKVGSDVSIEGKARLQHIYPSTIWSSVVWSGVNVNSSYNKTDSCALPTHETRLDDSIVMVYKYDDLLLVNKYPNRTYYLCANIEVPKNANPLASLGNPFTGTLMSNPSAESRYSITLPGMTSTSTAGLFSAVKGAYFKNFDLIITDDINVNSSADYSTAVGALFGYAFNKGTTPTTLFDVDVEFKVREDETIPQIKISGDSFSASYVGGVGGYADGLVIKAETSLQDAQAGKPNMVTVTNPSIIISGTTNSINSKDMYVGGLFGYVALSSSDVSKDIKVLNPTININATFEEGEYSTLAVGSMFGKLINSGSVGAEKTTLQAVEITDPKVNITTTADNGFVNFETIAVGGAMGIVEGVQVNNEFIINGIKIIKGDSTSLTFTNNGVYASSIYNTKGNISFGGTIGELGNNSNGYVKITDFNNSIESMSYVHNNNSTYLTSRTATSNINLGSVIGNVVSCSYTINEINSSVTLAFTISETDKISINIGGTVGKMSSGTINNLISTNAVQNNTAVILGENTILNIGGIVGKMLGGELIQCGYYANIVLTLDNTSYSNVNMGGLLGYASISDGNISKCFASGLLKLENTNDITQEGANLGGLVGYVYNSIKLDNSYSSNDIYTYILDTNNSAYNTIGGIIGMLEISSINTNNVNMSNVYSIANIVANKCSNNASKIGGIIGKAQSTSEYDIANILELNSIYYLAEFVIENNSMGIGLSVEEMLYSNSAFNSTYDGSNIWKLTRDNLGSTNEDYWVFPRLIWVDNAYVDPRLTPIVSDIKNLSTVLSENSTTDSFAIIVTNKETSKVTNSESINKKVDIYFKDALGDNSQLFNEVGVYSRVYGINMASSSVTAITTNNGKIFGTRIDNLSAEDGYIKINNGIDINPNITLTSGNVYGTNNGLVIYPKITSSASSITQNTSNDGQIKLGVFTNKTDLELNLGTTQILDSYIYNEYSNNYIYYSHSGNTISLSESEATDFNNFEKDFDFYNDWIIFSINEEMTNEQKENRKNGRVFLRWELKEVIGKNWYFEDIDLYSDKQTEYAEYAWSNYINSVGNDATTNDIEIGQNIITIKTAKGLAYLSQYINHGKYLNYKVIISNDINMEGKLFTPIGGGKILEFLDKNYFAGTFDGGNHTISNLLIISDHNSGLFGTSTATSLKDINIKNATLISTIGSMGTLVAIQKGNSSVDGVVVNNAKLLHTMQVEENALVGGIIGQTINSTLTITNTSILNDQISGYQIYKGINVGGLIGQTINSKISLNYVYNTLNISGNNCVGGLIGYADNNTKLTILGSYNLGDINSNNFAGGLVGKVDGNVSVAQCYNSSAITGDIVAGLIGQTENKVTFSDCYVSRGDVGDIVGGVENVRDASENNMNVNCIIGNTASAFVNVSNNDQSTNISFDECYSSLKDLSLTNTSNNNYYVTYVIGETDTNYEYNKLNTITHAKLSEPNNELFSDWSYTWSRISQKNNNYPVLLFKSNSSWTGDEPEKDEDVSDEDSVVYEIYTAAELAWVAEQVNTGVNDFENDTIRVIGTDGKLDFEKKLWNPIGYSSDRCFKGNVEFVGDIKIINLTTNGYYEDNEYTEEKLHKDYVGLFGYMVGSNISGKVTLNTYEYTENEGAHIYGKGSYVGAFAGYAEDINLDAEIINYLNVQGTGNYVGGVFGRIHYTSSGTSTYSLRSVTTKSLGSITNYGYTKGIDGGNTSKIAGIIGAITTSDPLITEGISTLEINADTLYNYGTISFTKGNVGGVVSEIIGKGFIFNVNNILNASSISGEGENVGGIIGYSNGKVIINNATISNDTINSENNSQQIRSSNSNANIGAVIGYVYDITLSNVNLDENNVIIGSENIINFTQNKTETGALGGLVGRAYNVELLINNAENGLSVSNISFSISQESGVSKTNNIGGVIGKVEGLLYVNATQDLISNSSDCKITVNGISGIEGVGYLGGIAGYVNEYETNDKIDKILKILVNNVSITETSSLLDTNYNNLRNNDSSRFNQIYGNIGGAFGYVKSGSDNKFITLKNITVQGDARINGKSNYIGGVVGRLGNYAKLTNINNSVTVSGDIFETLSNFVGGICGSIGDTTKDNRTILTSVNNYASVNGYSFVGGLVGELFNADVINCSSVSKNEDDLINIGTFETSGSYAGAKTDSRVGGLFGYTNMVDINNLGLSGYTFDGNIAGSNYVGGIVGYAKFTNVYNAKIKIDSFNVIGKQQADEEYYETYNNTKLITAGGAIGYAYSEINDDYLENCVIQNIDLIITNILDISNIVINGESLTYETYEIPEIGGVVGFAQNYNLYEVSTNIALNTKIDENDTETHSTLSYVSGIAQYLINMTDNSNWYSENYWIINEDNSERYIVNNGLSFENVLTLAYGHNLTDAPGNKEYNQTVVYTTINEDGSTSQVQFANSDIYSEETYEQTKQIFTEVGLWNMVVTPKTSTADEYVSLSMSKDLILRSSKLDYDGKQDLYIAKLSKDIFEDFDEEITENINLYEYVYAGINKRYDANRNAKSIKIEISGTIENAVTNSEQNYITSIGTTFFPIRDLTIEGEKSNEEIPQIILNNGVTYLASSSELNKYNLYGLIGYVENKLTISNITISSATNLTTINNVHYYYDEDGNSISPDYNSFFGVLVASGIPSTQSTTATDSVKHTFNNVTLDVNVKSAEAEYAGGLIGAVYSSTSTKYTIDLYNVKNTGNLFESSTSSDNIPLVVGGLVGTLDNSNNADQVTINVPKKNINNENNSVINEGNIHSSELSGGVFGYVENAIINSNNDTQVNNLIWNKGNITATSRAEKFSDNIATIAGGVIGELINYNTTLYNLYSGVTSGTQTTINAKVAGGVIGRVLNKNNSDTNNESATFTLNTSENRANIGTELDNIVYYGSGIVGDIIHANNIEFNNIVNKGEVYSNNSAFVGGIISGFVVNSKAYDNYRTYTIANNKLTNASVFWEENEISGFMYYSPKEVTFNSVINSSSNISSASYAGGIIGELIGKSNDDATNYEFINCQSEGNIKGTYAGGFAGYVNLGTNVIVSTTTDYEYKTNYILDSAVIGGDTTQYAGGLFGKVEGSVSGHIVANNGSEGETNNYLQTPTAKIIGTKATGGAVGEITKPTENAELKFIKIKNNSTIGELISGYAGGILARIYYNESNDNLEDISLIFQDCINNGDI